MCWLVRAQADDFFNAYKTLEKNGVAGAPGVVCLAFSLELYIKDIYYALKTENKFPRGRDGHNILKLYKKLPRHIKREIFFHPSIIRNPFALRGPVIFLRRFSGISRDYYGFIRQLETISDAFQNWRYPHEAKTASLKYDSWFAEALITAVKSAADSARKPAAA